jgi:hypothetical protein
MAIHSAMLVTVAASCIDMPRTARRLAPKLNRMIRPRLKQPQAPPAMSTLRSEGQSGGFHQVLPPAARAAAPGGGR